MQLVSQSLSARARRGSPQREVLRLQTTTTAGIAAQLAMATTTQRVTFIVSPVADLAGLGVSGGVRRIRGRRDGNTLIGNVGVGVRVVHATLEELGLIGQHGDLVVADEHRLRHQAVGHDALGGDITVYGQLPRESGRGTGSRRRWSCHPRESSTPRRRGEVLLFFRKSR